MLTFTDRAREVVNSFLDQSEGELEALRITTQPGSPVAPRYELTLVAKSERSEEEREVDGATLLGVWSTGTFFALGAAPRECGA